MDRSDPQIWGPGVWHIIHTSALTYKDIQQFKFLISNIIENIPCLECRGHATRYLNQHPITIQVFNSQHSTYGRIGAFVWTYEFHNFVNARKRKPILLLSDAYHMYSRGERTNCPSGNCGATNSQTNSHTNSSIYRPSSNSTRRHELSPYTLSSHNDRNNRTNPNYIRTTSSSRRHNTNHNRNNNSHPNGYYSYNIR